MEKVEQKNMKDNFFFFHLEHIFRKMSHKLNRKLVHCSKHAHTIDKTFILILFSQLSIEEARKKTVASVFTDCEENKWGDVNEWHKAWDGFRFLNTKTHTIL